MARLFVAVWPPDDVLDLLADLPRPEVRGVRWTTRDQWHVTLRFLGDVAVEEGVAALGRVDAAGTVAVVGPLVRRLGAGVVQVPVEGLDGVAAAVADSFEGVGREPDHPFHGHLTLARLKKGTRRCPLLGHEVATSFAATEIALVESDTHREGARYRTVATRGLRPV